MERIPAQMDDGKQLPIMIYHAQTLKNMQDSRMQVVEDTQAMIDERGAFARITHSIALAPDRGLARLRGLDYTIPALALITIPHVRHEAPANYHSDSTLIYDQTAAHKVLLPRYSYGKILRALGANIFAEVARTENWAGGIVLFNQYRTNSADTSHLIHINNPYVKDSEQLEYEELVLRIALRLVGKSR